MSQAYLGLGRHEALEFVTIHDLTSNPLDDHDGVAARRGGP